MNQTLLNQKSVGGQYFEQMFAENDDPWAMRHRWYERRKRALLLACLPREHYSAIFEPGCANGETSLALAGRCDSLLSFDLNARAVELTRQQLADVPYAQVRQGILPGDWPSESFDLIVLNELGYYLNTADLSQLIDQALKSLKPGGQLVACHWREEIEGCPLTAEQVHAQLDQQLQMHKLVEHVEPDFYLTLWARDAASVAQVEGLR